MKDNPKHLVKGVLGGMKCDKEKPAWALLPLNVVAEVVKVMTFGANKYKPGNWKVVEPHRYWSALLRHLEAYQNGEQRDPDSGLHHLSHALCNLTFLVWFVLKGTKRVCDHPKDTIQPLEQK